MTPAVVTFARWCATERGAPVDDDYWSLWRWSVRDLSGFWASVWHYFQLGSGYDRPLADERMPGAQWFPGSTVNYVRQLFRAARENRPAIIDVSEAGTRVLSWQELRRQVGSFAATLCEIGVQPGDRVVGYVPNTAEAVIAFLGTASIGAVWSSCGQDYAAEAAADRFRQLDPVVLVTADGYRHGGKVRDRRGAVSALETLLPSVRATISYQRVGLPLRGLPWETAVTRDVVLEPVDVPFDHPLWILFSSGTTGAPKGIVHGHGGVLLEHLKHHR